MVIFIKALITGASSGIGASFAEVLSEMGYDLILVARRKTRLESLKKKLKTNVEVITLDLSSTFNCMKLFDQIDDADILINNAGFGLIGEFSETSLDKELDMIDLNIKAVHTLTKCFLKKFCDKDSGFILNVSSIAAFSPGPLMATYYASKAYVFNMTLAILDELKKNRSNVYVGCLCPGPVSTEFNKVAKVKFDLTSMDSDTVARYAIYKMLKRSPIIIPGIKMKLVYHFSKFIPLNIKLKLIHGMQHKKVR